MMQDGSRKPLLLFDRGDTTRQMFPVDALDRSEHFCEAAASSLLDVMSRCLFLTGYTQREEKQCSSFSWVNFFPCKYQTHTRALWLDQADLCFDYLLPVGETGRGFDQSLLSQTSGCVLFTLQSRAAGVQDSSTAPAASCLTTRVPPSHVPTAGCAYPRLKVTCATARWTTPKHGKHTRAFYLFITIYLLIKVQCVRCVQNFGLKCRKKINHQQNMKKVAYLWFTCRDIHCS